MDIILHLGAHRTATTSFHHYMRDQSKGLKAHNVGYWGPGRTRGGLFTAVLQDPKPVKNRLALRRAKGRVRMQLGKARQRGAERLLISDENMIGSSRQCLRAGKLYPSVGERVARYADALRMRPKRAVLGVRALDLWWASAAAYTVMRGHGVPDAETLEAIAQSPRSWQDVITDLACALPETEIVVAPFEQFAGRPDALLTLAAEMPAAREATPRWLNRSADCNALRALLADAGRDPARIPEGDGRWQPFDEAQIARLRESYADDMHWLIAGADGLATLAPDPSRSKTGSSLQPGAQTEGSDDDDRGPQKVA